jgi:hypothetical protein
MYGTVTCGGTCSCPRCGYTFYGDDTLTVSYSWTGDAWSNSWPSYAPAKPAAKVNPKWRIWHRSPIVKAVAAILPLYVGATTMPFLRAHSAQSAAQVRRQKRRARVQRLCRALEAA